MQPKVSVIIPVYKAERDIARCCNALFNQTLDSIEYIFVDDCTPDCSIEIINAILHEYPNRKPFVKILHQENNSGVSACRQLGLENTTGEYVIHCDSDDWPELDMYETMYNQAIKESAEIVYCDFIIERNDSFQTVIFPDINITRPSFNISPIEGAVWNKLISRSLIEKAEARFFEGINLGEDFGFVTPCRVMSKKSIAIHKPLYHYNQLNSNSITHNYTKERFMQVVNLAKQVELSLKKLNQDNEYEKELCYLKFQSKMFFLICKDVRDIDLWKSLYPESNKYLNSYSVPFYLKITSWLIMNHCTIVAKPLLSLKSKISKF